MGTWAIHSAGQTALRNEHNLHITHTHTHTSFVYLHPHNSLPCTVRYSDIVREATALPGQYECGAFIVQCWVRACLAHYCEAKLTTTPVIRDAGKRCASGNDGLYSAHSCQYCSPPEKGPINAASFVWACVYAAVSKIRDFFATTPTGD